jgi:GNAT superfamily N-acetyltransferase
MYGKQPFAVVENIVVSSRSRGEGIGTSLLKYIESLCLEKGCSKMMLQSSIDRKEAHRFFKFLGYDQDKKAGFVKYRQNFISN